MAKNKNTSIPPELSSNTRSIRLYSSDDRELITLHSAAKAMNRKIDIVDLIRDCVEAGLPSVAAKWGPLLRDKK
jgi:hypothetical protein